MNKQKYLLLTLTVCAILICLLLIAETYGKYLTSASSTTTASIARWKIIVNEEDITLGATSSSIITPEFPGTSNIANGVLAPNAEGYFDLIIDASNVDVSVSYEISTKVNATSAIKELVVTGYSVNEGEIVQVTDQNETIKGTIELANKEQNTSIRVYIKWDDSLGIMSNEEDTEATKGTSLAKLDVTINVIQTN